MGKQTRKTNKGNKGNKRRTQLKKRKSQSKKSQFRKKKTGSRKRIKVQKGGSVYDVDDWSDAVKVNDFFLNDGNTNLLNLHRVFDLAYNSIENPTDADFDLLRGFIVEKKYSCKRSPLPELTARWVPYYEKLLEYEKLPKTQLFYLGRETPKDRDKYGHKVGQLSVLSGGQFGIALLYTPDPSFKKISNPPDNDDKFLREKCVIKLAKCPEKEKEPDAKQDTKSNYGIKSLKEKSDAKAKKQDLDLKQMRRLSTGNLTEGLICRFISRNSAAPGSENIVKFIGCANLDFIRVPDEHVSLPRALKNSVESDEDAMKIKHGVQNLECYDPSPENDDLSKHISLNTALLFEYASMGGLDSFLELKMANDNDLYGKIIVDVAKGMKYLHSIGVLHMDLASRNVLLHQNKDGSLIAKITDFGLSVVTDTSQKNEFEYSNTDCRLPYFQMPPVFYTTVIAGTSPKINANPKINASTDYYSFACLIFEIISGGLGANHLKDDRSLLELNRDVKQGIDRIIPRRFLLNYNKDKKVFTKKPPQPNGLFNPLINAGKNNDDFLYLWGSTFTNNPKDEIWDKYTDLTFEPSNGANKLKITNEEIIKYSDKLKAYYEAEDIDSEATNPAKDIKTPVGYAKPFIISGPLKKSDKILQPVETSKHHGISKDKNEVAHDSLTGQPTWSHQDTV